MLGSDHLPDEQPPGSWPGYAIHGRFTGPIQQAALSSASDLGESASLDTADPSTPTVESRW
jgi:hypothetical protein